MSIKRGWLLLLILIVLVVILLNVRFLGLAVYNQTPSEVIVVPDNSPPQIIDLNGTLYVCEGESLFYLFLANDSDGDVLTGEIVPQNPFFVLWYSQQSPNTHEFAIVSGPFDKGDFGAVNSGYKFYEETVIVRDGYNDTCCSDTEDTNITLIEINNIPEIEDIGVQTVYTQGDNSTFYEEVEVDDVEYAGGYGDLTFNMTVLNSSGEEVNLFNISSEGIIDFTADNETTLGVYDIAVCVQDTGLSSPHDRIYEECGQTGAGFSVCDNFTLTVTEQNRAPNITDYYPGDLSFSIPGTQTLYFNITKYDPDGTIPDAYWYLDGVFQEKDSDSSVDEFGYNFGCGVSGNYVVRVDITDGLLNDSLEWNVSIVYASCASPGGGGGSGGGGGVGVYNFEVVPEFVTTTLFHQEGRSFDINITNTGTRSVGINLTIENLTDVAILNEDSFVLGVGESKVVNLYLYALSGTDPGVYFGKVLVNGGTIKKAVNIVLEVKEKEPLFDLKVIIPKEYKLVLAGEDMNVFVNLLNVGLYGTAVDVELYLYIMDFDKLILFETSKEMIAVETNLTLERELHVPFDALRGTYLVLGEMKYNNLTVTTYDTFNIVEKKYVRVSYILVVVGLIVLILFILFLILKRRKKKKEEDR